MNISKYLRLEDISDDGLQVPEPPLCNVLLISSRVKESSSLLKQLATSGERQESFSLSESADEIESLIASEKYAAAIVAIEPQSGKELSNLALLRKLAPQVPVLVLASYKFRELARRAVKEGAQDFVIVDDSFPLELLKMRLESVIEKNRKQNNSLEFARLEKFVMRSVLENSPLVFVRFDHSFRIIDCNRYFEQKIGKTRSVLRGRSMFEVLQQIELTEFQRLAQGQEVLDKRLTLLDENNTFQDMFLDLFGWSFNRANQQESEIIMVGFDKTGAVKARHLQEEFVAAIVHDLRNPVLGHEQVFTAILDKKQNSFGEMNTALNALRSSNLKVLQLLDTLLDIYKMDSSESLSQVNPACFNEAVHAQIEEMRIVANINQQKIILNLADELPRAAFDQSSCFRVVSNLLFNAIKNSPSKSEIKVSTKANEDFVFLEISNPSFSSLPLESAVLFERFSFAQSGEGGKRTTSGLGLYFCKKTLERYGGSITCIQEAEPAALVTFIISVPCLK